jgi:hypothetical protein
LVAASTRAGTWPLNPTPFSLHQQQLDRQLLDRLAQPDDLGTGRLQLGVSPGRLHPGLGGGQRLQGALAGDLADAHDRGPVDLQPVGAATWTGSFESTWSITTGIVRIVRSGWKPQVHPPILASLAKLTKIGCTDMTCSVVSCTSTGELHERISAPHGRNTRISRSLPASPQASKVSSWTERDNRR